jgi:hypothetical protein
LTPTFVHAQGKKPAAAGRSQEGRRGRPQEGRPGTKEVALEEEVTLSGHRGQMIEEAPRRSACSI